MAKSKSGPALFDLITREKEDPSEVLKVPRWWDSAGGVARASAETSSVDKGGSAVDEPGSTTGVHRDPVPFIALEDDRFRVSFTSVTAAVGIFAALVTVLGAFELGRWVDDEAVYRRGFEAGRTSYVAEATSEIDAVRRQPPATEVIDSLMTDAAAAVAAPMTDQKGSESGTAEGPRWVRGHTYIVVQEFAAGHDDDVLKAQQYLADRGVAVERVRFSSGRVQLITAGGFDRDDATQRQQAADLLEKVHALGRRYFADGNGYKLEGYFKKLTGDSW